MVIPAPKKQIRIVILLGAPFTAQNFERNGISYLSKHFEVMVFDCTEWLGRNSKDIKCQRAQWHNFLAIKSEMDLAAQMEKYRPHYAIDAIGFHASYTEDILNILEKYRVKFVVVKTGNLPALSLNARVKNIFLGLSSKPIGDYPEDTNDSKTHAVRIGLPRVATNLLYKLWCFFKRHLVCRRLNRFQPFIGLLAGNKSIDPYTSKSNPIIWIGSNDYHTFHKVKSKLVLNNNCKIDEPFILFIDDNIPNASDWTLLGITPPVTGARYYPALNTFFEKIESIYDMPVKISGHPNQAADENYQSKMGGRSIVFGNAALMALQSTIVLVHGSTATSFAVLARKPIISLTSQELDHAPYGLFVRTMSDALGSPLVFIDRSGKQINDLKTLVVDEKKYSLYEANYLCNELSAETEPWGAFINFINENRFV